jgi:hypothetical protein
MTERSLLQIQILEKLGVPLITAAGGGMTAEGPQMAERLAALLSRAVQSALALAKAMDIPDNDPQADSVKLGLAALSSSLIAGHYRQTGKVPDDNDIKRLAGAMETILSYSDSFLPVAGRLRALEPNAYPADEHQIALQTINALAPVVNAVAAFPFGRPEKMLAQEVAGRLAARAVSLRQALMPAGADEGLNKIAELGILRGLSALYAACHEDGKARIMAMDEAGRAAAVQQNGGVLPMDPVWQAFESRAGMLEMLGLNVMPAGGGDARAPSGTSLESPPREASVISSGFITPPSAPLPPPAAVEGPPANPMSFFKPGAKKQGNGDQGQKG